LLRVDDQRRNAGGVPLIVGRVVEADIVGVGARPKAARFRIYRECYGLRRTPFSRRAVSRIATRCLRFGPLGRERSDSSRKVLSSIFDDAIVQNERFKSPRA